MIAPGFQTYRVNSLKPDVDERKLVRIKLAVAAVSQSVEVTAAAAMIQSEDGSLGQVIDGSVATELPLSGRRYSDLTLLVPGATESTLDITTRGPGWFVVNGNYNTQNNFVLEGVDNNQGTTNAQSLSAQVVQPSPDAIGEFKVQTNAYSAELGRSAGAAVNLVLKSGTDRMHGSAWYYNRDKALAATSWTWYSLFSYTYANALDEAGAWGAGSSPQYLDDFRNDRGPQAQTARHRATFTNVYELPFGRGRKFGSQWNRWLDGLLGGWQLFQHYDRSDRTSRQRQSELQRRGSEN